MKEGYKTKLLMFFGQGVSASNLHVTVSLLVMCFWVGVFSLQTQADWLGG